MNKLQYNVRLTAPSAEEFVALREQVGWGTIDLELAQASLAQSLFHICLYQHAKLIATGRVVGDGFMYFYIQDVIVDPQYQQHGLGNVVMSHIEQYLSQAANKGSTIGLLAAKGKEGFYQRFNYQARDGQTLGLGMCKFL